MRYRVDLSDGASYACAGNPGETFYDVLDRNADYPPGYFAVFDNGRVAYPKSSIVRIVKEED